jgi:hypothetical protein
MGRGRQKAKHTKVARDLKYFSPNTNYDSLEKELASSSSGEADKWSEFVDEEIDEDEESRTA